METIDDNDAVILAGKILFVPNYTPGSMADQAHWWMRDTFGGKDGSSNIKHINLQHAATMSEHVAEECTLNNVTNVDDFVQKILNEHLLLDEWFGHMVTDRAHLIALMYADYPEYVGTDGSKFKMRDAISKLCKEVQDNKEKYPLEYEQLMVRLSKVEGDLERKTKDYTKKFDRSSLSKDLHETTTDEEQINITLFTAFMHNRGGDLVNAAIFMKEMIKKNPHIKFTWIVKRDLEGRNADLLQHIKGLEKYVEIIDLKSSDYDKITFRDDGQLELKQDIDVQHNLNGNRLNLKKGRILTDTELEQMSDANFATWDTKTNGGWSELRTKMQQDEEFAKKMKAAHMFCATPNLHRFVEQDRELFKQLNKPFVAISEYDFELADHVNDKLPNISLPGLSTATKKYEAGFAPGHAGVYVDDTMLSQLGLDHIHSTDQALKNYLLGVSNTSTYKHSHTMFYGYFFIKSTGNPPEAKTSMVKIEEYVKNCIISAYNDPNSKDNIDIVIPGLPDDKFQAIFNSIASSLDKSKIRSVTIANKDPSNQFQENKIFSNSSSSGKTIRLINPKRVHRETIQCLLNDSELLCGLTGDQSWIEGLVKGKLTCYQAMAWKANFLKAFLNYIKTKFGQDAEIYQFYNAQLGTDKEQAWTTMMKLYNSDKPRLKQQALQLADFIKVEKNLVEHLDRIIEDAKQAKQLAIAQKAPPNAEQETSRAKAEREKAEAAERRKQEEVRVKAEQDRATEAQAKDELESSASSIGEGEEKPEGEEEGDGAAEAKGDREEGTIEDEEDYEAAIAAKAAEEPEEPEEKPEVQPAKPNLSAPAVSSSSSKNPAVLDGLAGAYDQLNWEQHFTTQLGEQIKYESKAVPVDQKSSYTIGVIKDTETEKALATIEKRNNTTICEFQAIESKDAKEKARLISKQQAVGIAFLENLEKAVLESDKVITVEANGFPPKDLQAILELIKAQKILNRGSVDIKLPENLDDCKYIAGFEKDGKTPIEKKYTQEEYDELKKTIADTMNPPSTLTAKNPKTH